MKIIRSQLLSTSPVLHGFSTRHARDLGFSSRQHREEVLASRREYFTELGASNTRAVFCNQVHGTEVLEADFIMRTPGVSCDGLYTSAVGVSLNILTADCIAVLFYDPTHHVAAACHAGWQGSAQGIVDACVLRLRDSYGTEPQDLLVALGPGASWCCYEVGFGVLGALDDDNSGSGSGSGSGKGVWWRQGCSGKPLVDLREYNRQKLQRIGILPQHIEVTGGCSICDEDCFSYRREGQRAGRMVATIELL